MLNMRVLMILVAGAWLAGCTSVPYAQHLQQRQQAYSAAAGAPVRSFRLVLGAQIYSWEPLSETQLVVYTLPTRAYLLDVWPCSNLTFTNTIGLTSFADQVQTGFDKVLQGRDYVPCMIKQIRPIDLSQLKLDKDREEQRHADNVQRDNGNGTPPPGNR